MIKELISNISAWLAKMPIDPAVKTVKYGFSSLVPATEQPAVYFNIAGVPRCNYLNGRGNSLIKINVDIMLITSVLASEEYATIEALNSPDEEIEGMRKVFDARREKLLRLIAEIDGVSAVEPDGAFYVMMVTGGLYGKKYGDKVIDGSIAFSDALLEAEKVATIPGISFGADDCVRLSYSLSESDIEEGLRRIKRFVNAIQ